MSMKKKKVLSPYAKFGKKPYVYSDHLQNWTAAVKAGDKQKMDRYDLQWKRIFAPHCIVEVDNDPR